MNNNEWITDRRPTEEDCVGAERMPDSNQVWVMYEGKVVACTYADVVLGCPWQPIIVQKPEPYVKPKRYTVKWLADCQQWAVMDRHYVATRLPKLDIECDKHREAAERIAAIYEEVKP